MHPKEAKPLIDQMRPGELSPFTYAQVEDHMLHSSYSFPDQMARAYRNGAAAFLVTANSAVPLADSIRGFYSELDAELPVINYIDPRKTYKSIGQLHRYIEKLRLESLLPDPSETIYVVDEYVLTGATINRARALLAEIGYQDVDSVKGRWYHSARRSDLDLDRVTSVHAPAMHAIGAKACRQAFSK